MNLQSVLLVILDFPDAEAQGRELSYKVRS